MTARVESRHSSVPALSLPLHWVLHMKTLGTGRNSLAQDCFPPLRRRSFLQTRSLSHKRVFKWSVSFTCLRSWSQCHLECTDPQTPVLSAVSLATNDRESVATAENSIALANTLYFVAPSYRPRSNAIVVGLSRVRLAERSVAPPSAAQIRDWMCVGLAGENATSDGGHSKLDERDIDGIQSDSGSNDGENDVLDALNAVAASSAPEKQLSERQLHLHRAYK